MVSPGDLLPRCAFPPAGTAVTCAVSGGADSLAMLALASEAGCVAEAVHVDHGLRTGSAEEAEVVADAARRFGCAFRSVRVTVAPGPNLEARARAARHAAVGPAALFGHTADDQAETVLLNVLRGAGVPGLAGIRDRARHPILALRRSETRALCDDLGLHPVEDPSNADPRHRRNRVRHEVLPLLDDVAGRDVVPVLARLAALAADAAGVLEAAVVDVDAADAKALRALPEPLGALAVRRWLQEETGAEHPPSSAAVRRVLAVAGGTATGCEVPGGFRVTRRAGRLSVSPPVPDDPAVDGLR